MCGRYAFFQFSEAIVSELRVACLPDWQPHYNIAPSQAIAVVCNTASPSGRQLKLLRWGLIPSWAKDPSIGSKLINARSETVAEKPSFRAAFKRRRCLILADGFYEWQRLEGDKRKKQPFYFRMVDDRPFALAGIWELWQGPDGQEVETCAILTTQANELLQPIHDRMPVILNPEDYDLWLDPNPDLIDSIQSLLKPYSADLMESHPVSTRVNSPSNDSPECNQPLV